MLNIFIIILLFFYNISTSEQKENKIIEGDEASIEEFPYVVSIRYNDNHVCGGAILDEKTIVTSAQCIFDMKGKPKFISIRAGSSEHADGLQIKATTAKPVHPATYKREFHENDIGIIKLASSLVWNEKIQPISLPDKDYVVPDNTDAVFVGWGVEAENGISISETLRKSNTKTISYIECTKQYGTNMIHLGMMLCAQAQKTEFCRGDIGGPLVLDGKLVGVASWIYDCDQSTHPGVYTNVVQFLDWIEKYLEKRP